VRGKKNLRNVRTGPKMGGNRKNPHVGRGGKRKEILGREKEVSPHLPGKKKKNGGKVVPQKSTLAYWEGGGKTKRHHSSHLVAKRKKKERDIFT